MLIMFENLDSFLEELRLEADKNKTRPIYLSIVRPQDPETGIMSAQIYIQLIVDGNALTYRYTDLPDITIMTPAYFDTMLSVDDSEKAKKRYELKNKEVNDKILAEYEKIKQVIIKYGYNNFKKAIVQ